MVRKGVLYAVLAAAVCACGGGGGPTPALLLTCGSSVQEGATVRLTIDGNDFDEGLVDVTADLGTVSRLTVDSPTVISFDYAAPSFPPRTLGPKAVLFTVTPQPGAPSATCSVTIHLAPYITTCVTSYAPDTHAAPTTGVFAGAFVSATLAGGNFLPGGALAVEPRGGSLLPLTEIAAATPFSAPGQFRVVSGTTLELTIPDVFSKGVATILDGSPNTGPATVRLLTPFGALATEEECFRYVPAFLDFEDFRFEVPGSIKGLGEIPGLSAPGRLAIGDINRDGVPDVVVLAQQTTPSGAGAPDAFLLLADTFGPGIDRDGDGKSPDFAGTFTAQVVNHPEMQTFVPEEGRGQDILLANLDDDPELEFAFSVLDDQGIDPVLLVDVTPGGVVGALTVLRPPIVPAYTAGIAVGDFDRASPHPDFAILYGADAPEDRKLVIFRSNAAFDYRSTVHDIPADYEAFRPGAIGAGDFDGDGDDDLVWGHYDAGGTGLAPEAPPILVARVDATAGAVDEPQSIADLTGTPVADVEVFDADGDGREDALVYVGGEVTGAFLGDHIGSGVVTLLDPFGLAADAYAETTYRFIFWDRAGNGRDLAQGDFDGDSVTDLAAVNDFGEVLVLIGNGDGTFSSSGRSWQTVTGATESAGPVQALDAFDFDGDGLSEILVGDMSNAPFNVVYWLNASR